MAIDKQKLRTLNKLAEKGFDTEKKVSGISLVSIRDNGLEYELSGIIDCQEAIRKKRLLAYLMNGLDDSGKDGETHGTGESDS